MMTFATFHRWPDLKSVMIWALWVLTCLVWTVSAAQAQVMPHQSGLKSMGTVNCASSTCHGSIDERSATPVLQNEYTTWLRQDPHTQAYAVLKNEQSRRIAKNLGLPKPAHESKVCLDCHSHNPPAAQRGPRFDATDGVNCEACHGPAEQWIKTHVEPNATHAKNVANGLYPTNEPYAVAKLCSSCHVGDASRPITHRIMGAGHPRISLETDTFLALQPPHYRIDADWTQRKGAFDSAKIWAMGQLVAAQNLADLMADPKRNRQGILPELMVFDCHACHSPMSKKDWTPKLGSSPGQARINDSSLLMLQALLKGARPELYPTLASKVNSVHVAATSPASSMTQFETAARDLQAHLKSLQPQLASSNFNTAQLDNVLRELLNLAGEQRLTDFAGAEQVYMSMSAVANGLQSRGNSAVGSKVNQRLPALLAFVRNDESYDRTAFQQELVKLKASVGGQ
ncbi:cytochrome c family protein [Limnobacter humi]|uniref:Cytochrome c family protein n=1 Tax=Limnobacter humi TaxID=1778671 RepID=A0ABT1WFI8_9BURK|nr:cytochrome c family protein [Limnobacter humi]MCQ8896280.1 cytochrome c family protein [Limnobacter humi]